MVAPAAWVALSFFAIVIFVVPTLLIVLWGPKSAQGRLRRNTEPERFEFRRGDAAPPRSTWQPPRDKRWSWGFNTSTASEDEEARGRMVESETNPPASARLSLVREEEDAGGGPGGDAAQYGERWQQRHHQESGGQRWYNSWRASRQQQHQQPVGDEGVGLELVDARLVTPPRLERPRFDGYRAGSASLQPPRPLLSGSPAAMSPSSSSSFGPPNGSYPPSSGSYFEYGSASPQAVPQEPVNTSHGQQSNASPSLFPPTAPLTVHRPQPTRANQVGGASGTNPFRFGAAAAPPSYNNTGGPPHSAPVNGTTLRPPMPDRAPTYTTLASPSLSTLQTTPLPDDVLRSFPVPAESTQDQVTHQSSPQAVPAAEPERERRCSTPIWAQRATMPLLRTDSGSNDQSAQDPIISNGQSTPRSPPAGAIRRPPAMSPSMSTRELQQMTGQRVRDQ